MTGDQLERYNGWTNRETWACHLWLSNDEALYEWARRIARSLGSDGIREGLESLQASTIDPDGTWAQAEEFGLTLPLRDALLALSDIGSLWRVSYDEVAHAFLEE